MKKKLFLTIFFILAISFSLIFIIGGKQGHPDQLKIKIIETSDVHGSIFPWDFKNDQPAKTSLAQISTYVNEQRANKEQEVVLIDDGDLLQGQPIVYYYNFEKPNSKHIVSEVMNYMKYDLAVVGNHDLEAGHAVYDKVAKEFNFPWLAADAVKVSDGKPYFPPYKVIVKKGVKIVVLGMVTPWIPNWLPENLWSGMKFEDMVQCAKKWVKIIKEKEKPDILIGAFHAGVDYTYHGQTAETLYNENASELVAKLVPGFDIVFVGHDHHGWNYKTENGVLILGAINAARTAAVANINLKWDKENKKWVKDISGEIIDTVNYEPDPEFMKKFGYAVDETKKYLAQKIGEFTKTITTRDAMFGDSAFVDLIHKIQLELTNADISFAAPLSFDTSIKEGPVYVRDMFKLYKYENMLYTMELTGKEVKDYLEYSYGNWFNQMKGPDDHIINFKRDKNGELIFNPRYNSYDLVERYYNYDSAAGIIYTVDVSKPVGQRINIVSMADGSAFDLNKKYLVAINSYRGNGGGGHLIKGAGIPKEDLVKRMKSSTVKDLRYYLMKWIEKKGTVTPEKLNNWKVIPEDWVKNAIPKDYELLYGKNE